MPVVIRAHVDRLSGEVDLRFAYDPATVQLVKELPGARWRPDDKLWRVDLSALAVLESRTKVDRVSETERRAAIPEPMHSRLRPYQRDGAGFLIRHGGALLTMDMRTGKTPTAISAACALMGSGQADALVCIYPASVMGEWQDQLKAWANLTLCALETYEPLAPEAINFGRCTPYLTVGCHYEILAKRIACLAGLLVGRRYVLIADEIQHCKNRKIDRTKVLWDLAHSDACVARWGLTGTPQRNYPRDLFGLFEFTRPGAMGGYWTFAKRYADAHQNDRGHWEDHGSTNEEELAQRLAAVSFRVTRAQVAEWLPKSDRKVIMCSVGEKQLSTYRKLERHYAAEFNDAMAERNSREAEAAVRELVQATSAAKIPTALQRAYEHLERGVKVLVFAHFHETLRSLESAFDKKRERTDPKTGEVTEDNSLPPHFCAGGWLTPEKRRTIIERWRSCPGPSLLLANSLSSGVGIDLSDAEVAIFLELEWVPSDFRQAEDRIQDVHKGKRKTPPVYEYLLVQHTVDERMAAAVLNKVRSIEAVVGSDAETAGVAATLRGAGVVGSGRLGLENTNADTVKAALQHLRDRMLGVTSAPAETGESLAAEFEGHWEDDPADMTDNELNEQLNDNP